MPSKQFLMGLKSAEAALKFGSDSLNIDPGMKIFKILPNSRKQVTLAVGSESFTGEGSSKLEAVADAISKKFPA